MASGGAQPAREFCGCDANDEAQQLSQFDASRTTQNLSAGNLLLALKLDQIPAKNARIKAGLKPGITEALFGGHRLLIKYWRQIEAVSEALVASDDAELRGPGLQRLLAIE